MPDTAQRLDRLRAEQVASLYRNVVPGTLGSMLAATILAILLNRAGSIALEPALVFVALVYAQSLTRFALVAIYRKARPPIHEWRRWAYAACAVALAADAAVLGSWSALLRAVIAAAAAFGLAALLAATIPEGLGFGDVKLLALLGLVLGWIGWGVLLAGVFLGLLTGALVSLVLLATRRAALRTPVPFGPPLLTGAVIALALAGSGSPI